MMTHSQIKIFVTEAMLLAILSAALIVCGFLWSNDRADRRLQREYKQKFGTVLPAESYTPLTGRVLNDFPEINSVYRGYDKDGTPVGYVFDMTVVLPSDKSTKLDFRIGIDYETSRVTGLMCEDAKTDRRLKYLETTLKGKQIPVAFRRADTTVSDDETYAPVDGLKDGIYYAQRLIDDRSKFVDYVEMEIKGGKITRVNWDAFNLDMTTEDRSYASLSGAYEISGLDWAVQSYNICHALLKLQDPDRLAMKSDGTTNIIEGVTCSIQCFVDLSKECINNSRAGYTKEKYLAAINRIYTETMGSSPDADGVRIAELDEMTYRQYLWAHTPITDFWRVGRGYARRLQEHGMLTMGDIARCSLENEDLLYKIFGINAELLIDHAWGWEPCEIKHIKAYKPETNSLSVGQVLQEPYSAKKVV